ncbi:MAG TPA: GvpL/GvpF family gas vesicle protein [Streptosporangiaceae bacterium]|nr:GvpL/GvpF family gas vesicle protein [Streptosporangiaceae bacterium]
MSESTKGRAKDPAAEPATEPARTELGTGWYVYGIVRSGVKAPPRKRTVGTEHRPAGLVRSGDIAALVSPVRIGAPLGTPDDLMAHQRLLDAVAARAAVLPMRFGAVLDAKGAVRETLLAPYHDEFAEALGKFAGTVQYVITGRYVEDAVLTEVLAEHSEAAALAAAIRGKSELATRELRIRLGELVNEAIAAKRQADSAALMDTVGPYCEAVAARQPSHEEDAACLALLVRRDKADQQRLRQSLNDVAARWRGRVDFRLLGPMAPYDFVVAAPAS